MQGFDGLLCLATVAIEALLSVEATALSSFGLFAGVSFGLGPGDLLIYRDHSARGEKGNQVPSGFDFNLSPQDAG